MMEKKLSQLFMLRAKACEGAVVPAHAAIAAVFPTEIGDFHDRPDEHPPTEVTCGGLRGAGMKGFLRRAF